MSSQVEIATLGGGCFWCTEAVFDEVVGVSDVVSGYTGGQRPNPTYEQICNGDTGHAEVVRVTFDPAVISYATILGIFFATHDPTTLNRQGNDRGTQYRSAIFVHSPEQRRIAEERIANLNAEGTFDAKLVTEVSDAGTFYPAEDYHQEFFKRNPNQGYCMAVVSPKVSKFRKLFADKLKK
ncbi:MAG TPA: peptide-methionine (S)-S-oxide reductase MsrA [Usitatibacteraceae bacterium]